MTDIQSGQIINSVINENVLHNGQTDIFDSPIQLPDIFNAVNERCPRMIFRINYLTIILLSFTVVLSAPVPLPESLQNGALESRLDSKLEAPEQIAPRDIPSVALTDGPSDSAMIAAIEKAREDSFKSPRNSEPPMFASDSAKGQTPTIENPLPNDGSPSQPKKDRVATKQQNLGQDYSNLGFVEVGYSQGKPALGPVSENSNASPRAGGKHRTPRPQNQQGKTYNPPVAKEQSKPGSMKEKPKAGHVPEKIHLFGRPHERRSQYVAG